MDFENRTPGRDVRMLESTIALLGGLCLGALSLLMGACIAGSVVAALRAVSRGSAIVVQKNEDIRFRLK
jgi:hypothetical protein